MNVSSAQTRTVAGRAGSVTAEVNVGCAAETQCHFALPVAFIASAGRGPHAGLGDVELGAKYRYFNQPDAGWSAAVYPTVDVPTGDAHRSLGNGRVRLLLPLWAQRCSIFVAYQLEL